MSNFRPPGDCPNCGEPVPEGADACPSCGSDERAGWNEDSYLDGVDLPGDDDDTARRAIECELGGGLPRGRRAWLALALAVMLALMLSGAWWFWGRP